MRDSLVNGEAVVDFQDPVLEGSGDVGRDRRELGIHDRTKTAIRQRLIAITGDDMKFANLAARAHLEADIDGPDAEKPHPFIHVIVPPRTDGIGNTFAITTQRCCLGGDGGAAAV